jgi:hypothetical protein
LPVVVLFRLRFPPPKARAEKYAEHEIASAYIVHAYTEPVPGCIKIGHFGVGDLLKIRLKRYSIRIPTGR